MAEKAEKTDKRRKNFTGILEIDYPGLTDAQIRVIETDEPEKVKMPDGKSLREYQRIVQKIKEKNLAEEAAERESVLKARALEAESKNTQEIPKEKSEEEIPETEVSTETAPTEDIEQ